MALTLQQLQAMGGQPVSQPATSLPSNQSAPSGGAMSAQQLQSMGAKQVDPVESAVKKNPNAWGALFDQVTHVADKIGNGLGSIAGSVLSNEGAFGQTIGTAAAAIGPEYGQALESKLAQQNKASDLYKQIAQMKKAGKDTTRAEQQYKMVTGKPFDIGLSHVTDMSAGSVLGDAAEKTPEQIAGEGLGVATDIISAGSVGKAKAGLTAGTQTAKQLALQGAKTGAVLGGVYGVSSGMQANKNLGGVAGSAATGAALGGALGGATGYIAGKLKPTNAEKVNNAINNLNPTAGKKITGKAVTQGRATAATIFRDAAIDPSKRAVELGSAYPELLQSKSAITNTNKVLSEGAKTETQLQEILAKDAANMPTDRASKLAINKGINNAIDSSVKEMPRGLKSQTKQYKDLLTYAKEIASNHDATAQGVIDARRELDAQIKKEYPQIIDSVTGNINEAHPITAAWRAVRNSLNNFAYNMSGVSNEAKSLINKESDLFDIGRILKDAAVKETKKQAGYKELVKTVTPKLVGGGLLGLGIEEGIRRSIK